MTPISIANIADATAEALRCRATIVIAIHADDTIQVAATDNINHTTIILNLGLAAHAVLSDHDARVLAGEAGQAARDLFETLANGASR